MWYLIIIIAALCLWALVSTVAEMQKRTDELNAEEAKTKKLRKELGK